jgi:hypothetical protein
MNKWKVLGVVVGISINQYAFELCGAINGFHERKRVLNNNTYCCSSRITSPSTRAL